jgi:hypothetical protein
LFPGPGYARDIQDREWAISTAHYDLVSAPQDIELEVVEIPGLGLMNELGIQPFDNLERGAIEVKRARNTGITPR